MIRDYVPSRRTAIFGGLGGLLGLSGNWIEQASALNRAGFAGGSNFQIGWSHHEQYDQ